MSFSCGRGLAWSAAFSRTAQHVKIGCYFLNVLILEIISHHFARAFGLRKEPALSEVERVSSQRFGDWVALRRISSKVERVVLNALAK
jgi:hypothetical protein